jgi:hypothetical protein
VAASSSLAREAAKCQSRRFEATEFRTALALPNIPVTARMRPPKILPSPELPLWKMRYPGGERCYIRGGENHRL